MLALEDKIMAEQGLISMKQKGTALTRLIRNHWEKKSHWKQDFFGWLSLIHQVSQPSP